MEELMAENGMSIDGYLRWLMETGRHQGGRPHDNWGNRIEYFALLERQSGLPPMFRDMNMDEDSSEGSEGIGST